MAAMVTWAVIRSPFCTRNKPQFRKRNIPVQLLPAREPLFPFGVDLLGPVLKSKRSRKFLYVITARFQTLAQAGTLRKIDAYTVAQACAE